MSHFSGRIAVVTGAASGIGRAIAADLADQGARIVGVDVSDQVADVCRELPGDPQHVALTGDVSDPATAERVSDTVRTRIGSADILVNCAGIGVVTPALETSPAEWQHVLDVNLSAAFYFAQAFGRSMVERGYGRIVTIASQAASIGLDGHAAYAASKAGIIGFTRVLALEWASRGVTVNTVSPTVVETPMAAKAWAGEKGERARASIPVGRFAQPGEVARLVSYLASEDAAMITGQDVKIDGGYTAV